MLPQHLQLSSSNPYLIDQLHFMQQQESSHYQCCNVDYLTSSSTTTQWTSKQSTTTVTPSDRRTMATWSYDIVDACSIPREIAIIGMSYCDRFLSSSKPSSSPPSRAKAALTNRREYQLAFITCLIIALKNRAGMQVDSDFVSTTICQGLYDPQEIIDMEKDILSGLGWRLNGPSPHEFIGGLIELMPSSSSSSNKKLLVEQLTMAAGASVELAMLDISMAMQKPSNVAFAALLSAMSSSTTTTTNALLHPLDRLAWLQTIAMVTGLKSDDMSSRVISDRLFDVSSPPQTPPRSIASTATTSGMCGTPPTNTKYGYNSVVPEASMDNEYQYYNYCSPVSSSSSSSSTDSSVGNEVYDEHLYLDVLSMASDGSSSSDLSPVCAMLDGRLEL
ncbi:hypothetical protein ACHAXR_004595 [Thalassiosira sp. AJA248-18]